MSAVSRGFLDTIDTMRVLPELLGTTKVKLRTLRVFPTQRQHDLQSDEYKGLILIYLNYFAGLLNDRSHYIRDFRCIECMCFKRKRNISQFRGERSRLHCWF